jgi:hypothetical protein
MKERQFKSTTVDGKEVEAVFKKPSQQVLTKGDFVYRTEFSNAVRAGVMTNAEANKLLKERGIWDDSKDDEERKLRTDISMLEKELGEITEQDPGLAVVEKLRRARIALRDLTSLYSAVLDNTAESIASDARSQYFASECSVYKIGGKKIFTSLDDFRKRMDEKLASDCYKEVLIANWEQVLGIEMPSGFNPELAEEKWLRSLAESQEAKVEAPAVAT